MADPTSASAGKDPPPPASSSTDQMPPPPLPHSRSRPSIITQAPSTTNIPQTSAFEPQGEAEAELPIPPNFNPFFVLIDDVSSTGATTKTVHPRKVHYLFADDDASHLLTGSLVEAGKAHGDGDEGEGDGEGEERVEERVLILDFNKNGDGIEKVLSLSDRWQVLGAEVGNAPTLQDGGDERGAGGGLMVRVRGVGVDGFQEEEGAGGEDEGELEEGLMRRFEKGLGVLGGVVGLQEQQEREERERQEEQLREIEQEGQGNMRSGLEVSRGDLSLRGKEREKERKDSLPEEDIGEG